MQLVRCLFVDSCQVKTPRLDAMDQYSSEQRLIIVKTHYKNGENYAETVRRLRAIFGRNNAPNESTVRRLIKKFETKFTLLNEKTPVHRRVGRSIENIVAVRESVAENPGTSIRHRGQELNISRPTLQRILRKDLHLHAYKVLLTQELKPTDHAQRRAFVDWALAQHQVDPDFSKKIFFSDEAHFQLNGYVNKQNCRIWGSENPRVIIEKSMHPPRVTVWCAFWNGGVIGPYFFENVAGNAVTVNGVRYREMVTEFLWPQLDGIDVENMFFQQDGATCHTAHETMVLLRTKFPDRVISRFGDQNWPPRSCDLTPMDFFLWGYLKGKVYANKPRTVEHLKEEIRRVIGEIEQPLCENVIENFKKRLTLCQRMRGGHLPDVLFHV